MTLTSKDIISRTGKDYPTRERSYSPFCSSTGLIVQDGVPGAGAMYLNYNRFCRPLFGRTLEFPFSFNAAASCLSELRFGNGDAALAFYGTDCFICESKAGTGLLRERSPETVSLWTEKRTEDTVILYGYSANGDDRDPDAAVPFRIGARAIEGRFIYDGEEISAVPGKNGRAVFAVAVEALDIAENGTEEKLMRAPREVSEAKQACEENIRSFLGGFEPCAETEKEAEIIKNSLTGLLFNLTRGQGDLREYISSYPNRGEYPTHFLWDSCFQNLAYELFSPALAEDFLRQFIKTQRSDGKFCQFLCSTWARPRDTQPALIGWAALRLIKQTGNREFAADVLAALEKNNRWWLTQRITDAGVIYCPGGLETGQDDSPRFDCGETLACDMNAYLLHQLYSSAEIAAFMGDTVKADALREKGDGLAAKMRKVLYCPEDGIFYDVSLKTRDRIKLVSPSSFLPVWAGALPETAARESIKKYLLNRELLFGDVPFPSVAYNEPAYESDHWWRGPTWMPVAYLMLETLERYGFEAERTEAARRLYDIMLADGDMREHYDSATGKGMGAYQQGWTCAIFLKLLCGK